MAVRRKYIRRIAEQLLDDFSVVRPPVPVESIAHRLGVTVRRAPADHDLSGFVYRDSKVGIVIVGINSTHSSDRQRFAIAHELGHLLFHERDGIHVDHRFAVSMRSKHSNRAYDDEREANLFATELLIPIQFIKSDIASRETVDLEDQATLRDIAAHYGVSTQSLAFRLAYLKLLQV